MLDEAQFSGLIFEKGRSRSDILEEAYTSDLEDLALAAQYASWLSRRRG